MSMPKKSGPILPPSTGAVKSIVVILHGYGADADDLFGLAGEWAEYLPDTAFIALNAPDACEGNPFGRQWFSLFDMDESNRRMELTYWPMEKLAEGGAKAAQILNAWLDELLAEHNVPDSKMAIAGFSQGGMMAMHTGLRRTKSPAGIISFSGRLLQPESLAGEIKSTPPVMLRHGDRDDVVAAEHLQIAQTILQKCGVTVDARIDSGMGHSISGQSVVEAGKFLAKILN